MSCRQQFYEKFIIKLDSARDGKEPEKINGTGLFIKSISAGATFEIRIEKHDFLDFNADGGLRYIELPFNKLYFKHDAQTDKRVELWVLRKGTRFLKGGDFLTTRKNLPITIVRELEFLRNGNFESGSLHWTLTGASLETTVVYKGSNAIKFDAITEQIEQVLLNPVPVSWLDKFSFYMRVSHTDANLSLRVYYTDGSYDDENFTCDSADTFEQKFPSTDSFDVDKTITKLFFVFLLGVDSNTVYLDSIKMETRSPTVVEQFEKDRTITSGAITEDNSADILTALGQIETAIELIDNVISGNEAQVDIVSMPVITAQGTITHISKTETGDLKTIGEGHTLKLHGFFFYCSTDITVELRFKDSDDVIGGLTCEGAVGMNFIGMTPPEGADAEDIELYMSGAGTVKGWICTTTT